LMSRIWALICNKKFSFSHSSPKFAENLNDD